jgi:ribosomal-protein-alanine N-acetyltransferase
MARASFASIVEDDVVGAIDPAGTLHTARLRLRPLVPGDTEAAVAVGADERVMAAFGGAQGREQSEAWLARQLAHWRDHGFGRFVVEADRAFVGFVGLSRHDFDAGIVPDVEIAWRLAFARWGRGYATEAARAVLRDGFERLGFERIVAVTASTNVRSRRVMERLGMTPAPAEAFDHPLVPAGSPLVRHVVYRATRGVCVDAGARCGNNRVP